MKILFVAVFDNQNKSTNNSQSRAFKALGHNVYEFNYRVIAENIGSIKRDLQLVREVETINPDFVIYSKCSDISFETFEKINQITTTCFWFMDALSNYSHEMKIKTLLVDFFCCDKGNVLKEAQKINKNSFHVCEGFDDFVDKPYKNKTEYGVSFIGALYGNRAGIIDNIMYPVKIISNAYAKDHAIAVSKSKINLNFCTTSGASDRVYKILGANGFLLSDDWCGRSEMFTDGEDLVIFNSIKDLNEKIKYFLDNENERKKIRKNGNKTVQKYTRIEWAKNILNIYDNSKDKHEVLRRIKK